MAYRYLWSPLRLGPVTVRNRIVFSAHLTNYAEDGRPTEQHAAYYEARAAGGAGLIITEEHSTHPTDWPYEKLIHGFHRDVIPGYRRITDAVHRHRVADLRPDQPQRRPGVVDVHAPAGVGAVGRWPTRCSARCPRPSTRPRSPRSSPATPLVAEHCAEGGFDGIELQCSHSSIVRGFLSPATNRRTDGYGGSLENRARLLLEIVAAVREAIGSRPRARRAPLRRRADRGRHHDRRGGRGGRAGRGDRARRLHQHLDRRGHGVAVHDRGVDARPARLRAVHPVRHPQGRRPAGGRRRPVQGPAAGRAGAGRGPLRPRRRRARARSPTPTSRPRPAPAPPTRSACACRATRSASGGWASTAGSAASRTRAPAGRRSRARPRAGRAAAPKDVLVVGAGPAGLQAAIAAARNGHRVTVCERDAEPGRAGPPGGHGAQPGRVRRPRAQPAHRVPPARRHHRVRRRRVARAGRRAPPRPRDRGHRRRAGPPVVGAGRRRRTSCDVRDVLDGCGRTRSATSS